MFHETITALCSRVYCIEDPHGAVAAQLLSLLREEAAGRGCAVIACPCPLSPEKLDHLLLPEAGVAFVTRNGLHPLPPGGKIIRAERFTDKAALKVRRVRLRFLQKTADTLLRQAGLCMAAAHRQHDRLESIYIGATDFAAVDRLADGLLQKLAEDM